MVGEQLADVFIRLQSDSGLVNSNYLFCYLDFFATSSCTIAIMRSTTSSVVVFSGKSIVLSRSVLQPRSARLDWPAIWNAPFFSLIVQNIMPRSNADQLLTPAYFGSRGGGISLRRNMGTAG